MQSLLGDLLDLARLDAGRERLEIRDFDASVLLRDLCDATRPLAAERGLFLKAEGPASLPVRSDPTQVYRIAQNLLLNAVRATETGGVTVSWRPGAEHLSPRWVLCIEDTGRGLEAARGEPLLQALQDPSQESQALPVRESKAAGDTTNVPSEAAGRDHSTGAGEGIGLSIVKRLCELLHASLELDTGAQRGTTFCLSFPREYPQSARNAS